MWQVLVFFIRTLEDSHPVRFASPWNPVQSLKPPVLPHVARSIDKHRMYAPDEMTDYFPLLPLGEWVTSHRSPYRKSFRQRGLSWLAPRRLG
jgi:hypothetical protein